MAKNRFFFATLAAYAVMMLLLPGSASAQGAGIVNIPLFKGQVGDAANVKLGSWGSGRAEESRGQSAPVLLGDVAIKITTQGLYQGGRIDFPEPIDIAPAFANTKTYVRFQMRFGNGTANGSGEGRFGGGAPGFSGGDPEGGAVSRGRGNQGGFPGQGAGRGRGGFGGRGGIGGGYPGAGGFGGGFGQDNASPVPFQRIRFLITMADGTRYELTRPFELPPSEDDGAYVPITFPVAAILKKNGTNMTAPTGEGAKIKQIAVFGDRYRQFWIGEVGIITDDTDIVVQPLEDQVAFINDRLTFVGDAEGGASTLKYSWDFNAADGIQEDAVGRVVAHVFTKPGNFTLTLTVSDVDGLKKPVTTSIPIEVSE